MPPDEVVRLEPEVVQGGQRGFGSDTIAASRFLSPGDDTVYEEAWTIEDLPPRDRLVVKRELDPVDAFAGLRQEPLRNVRAREARPLANMMLFFVFICAFLAVLSARYSLIFCIPFIAVGTYFIILALIGLSARRVFVMGNEFLIQDSQRRFQRFTKNSVTSALRWPFVPGFRCLRMARRDGPPVVTVVRTQDLSWILVRLRGSAGRGL